MKIFVLPLLSLFCLPLSADSDENLVCDKSPNCKVCKKKREALAMQGERYDNRLSDEANRAAENGNSQREEQLENREENADSRQDMREDDGSLKI